MLYEGQEKCNASKAPHTACSNGKRGKKKTLSIYEQDKGTLLQSWHTELLKLHSVCYTEQVPHVLQQILLFFLNKCQSNVIFSTKKYCSLLHQFIVYLYVKMFSLKKNTFVMNVQ